MLELIDCRDDDFRKNTVVDVVVREFVYLFIILLLTSSIIQSVILHHYMSSFPCDH